MTGFAIFFQLIVMHAIADFVLQPESMGAGKNRHHDMHNNRAGKNFPPWYYWLMAHALTHGGAVYLVTGSVILGMVETLLHGLIDFTKCEGRINFHQDQALHVVCKAAYCFL